MLSRRAGLSATAGLSCCHITELHYSISGTTGITVKHSKSDERQKLLSLYN